MSCPSVGPLCRRFVDTYIGTSISGNLFHGIFEKLLREKLS